MSTLDPAPEARGGASWQRENYSDLDDVNVAGANHLARPWYSYLLGKWVSTSAQTTTKAVPTFGTFGAGITAVAAGTGYTISDASGVVVTTGLQSAAGVAFTVTFNQALPTGVFPKVSVGIQGSGATAPVSLWVSAVTNTGFTVYSAAAIPTGSLIRYSAES